MQIDTHSTVDALLSSEVDNVTAYAGQALRLLRRIRSVDVWMSVYERGLREAYRHHDMDGLAAVVSLAAYRFDASAQFDQVVTHLDFALAMSDGLPDAVTMLQSMKAPALMMDGDIEQARAALKVARSVLSGTTAERAKIEYAACNAVVSCMTLDSGNLPAIRSAVGLAEQAGVHQSAVHVMSWLVPLMFAVGRKDEAAPWIRALAVHAEELGHPHRMADAHTYSEALRGAWGPSRSEPMPALAAESQNWLAALRRTVLRYREALLQGEWAAASDLAINIEELRPRISRGNAESLPYYRAILTALESPSEILPLDEPMAPTLLNLGGLLAAAEAVAIAGTQRDAVRWLGWIELSVRADIRSSLEWPVSKDRVLGLLRVRAGSVKQAVRSFRDAIEWASRAGYEAEAALAQVQLAEVLALSEVASSDRARQRLRKAGWMKLQELNIDPTPHAYAATRALALRDDVATRPQLTPRQVEVLSLLAEGLTYKQAAERLGTSWRTVSTQAYQAYERLGVDGKHEAVKVAQQLQIL